VFGFIEILSSNIIVQGIGFLAFLVALYAFSRTSDKQLKVGQAAQNFILALHFYLLGAGTAASMSVLTGIRSSLSVYQNLKVFAPLFLAVYLIIGFYTFEELVDVLPVMSALLGTTAVFYLSNVKMRLIMMLSTTLWIIHNALVVSIGPLLMEMTILVITARATYQLWRSGK
jgi:hypothetical protein